jgi:multidrug efflux pump subunit AcrA (membrane-fusion protein)
MALFREKALQALSNPEQLDQPLRLIRPAYWSLLIGLLAFSASLVAWLLLGRLPVRVEGKGILLRPGTLQSVQTESGGTILSLEAKVGDCVAKGTALATIDPVELRLKAREHQRALEELRRQDSQEDREVGKLFESARADLAGLEPYRDKGIITEQTFIAKEQQIQSLRVEKIMARNQRTQAMLGQEEALKTLLAEIKRNGTVRAPAAGCIVDELVHRGQVVPVGANLFDLEKRDGSQELRSLAFFPARDGKRLKVGQPVRVTPTTTRAQRHGGIRGQIVAVRQLPVSRDALLNRFGNPNLVDAILAGQSEPGEPLIEVETSLQRSPRTFSGYDWSGGQGPHLSITAGTATQMSVIVEWRRPIGYLIPMLRDLSGIY